MKLFVSSRQKVKQYINIDMFYYNTQEKIKYLWNLLEDSYVIEIWECEIYEQGSTYE